jgi:prepilin-type N-terminal cleavage/methylation domain-containing protein
MLFKNKNNRGFSLIELLVTLAISIVVVSAVLFRFDSFDSVVVLKSIAYEVALTVREAQIFAVSAAGDTSGNFDTPYGVYVNLNNPQEYIFFEDNFPSTPNLQYDSGQDNIIETYTMNSKYQFFELCVDANCNPNWVSLVFQRPNFDPTIRSSIGSSASSATFRVSMTDNSATTFSVVVGLTGQVSVTSP